MIDTDRYEIDDDVVWIWNDSDEAYDEEKKTWVYGVEHANWQLWEYKECPPEKGGYPTYREGEDDESTHEPWNQLLPAIPAIEWNKNMEAIQDVPFFIREIKRLSDKLFEAETHIDPLTDDYTFENDVRELHYIEEGEEE
tara:strand:+ start:44 stop:463 length:420 start_codon:yes stop_codon:yes gene_type:complete